MAVVIAIAMECVCVIVDKWIRYFKIGSIVSLNKLLADNGPLLPPPPGVTSTLFYVLQYLRYVPCSGGRQPSITLLPSILITLPTLSDVPTPISSRCERLTRSMLSLRGLSSGRGPGEFPIYMWNERFTVAQKIVTASHKNVARHASAHGNISSQQFNYAK